MSHFSVLVIGDNSEDKLSPYQENNMGDCPKEYLEFHDVEEEYRNEFENDTRSEFYCNSSSSWGQEVNEDVFNCLKEHKIGDKVCLSINKQASFTYFKNNCYYNCYYNEKHEYPEELIWIKVINIINTNHPDKDVCFEGTIEVELINPPKDIPLKEYYNNNFELFIKDWAGYDKKDEEIGKYGYWENPNAKWDWYQLGGRARGCLKLKEDAKDYDIGDAGLFGGEIEDGFCDSAKLKDLDLEYLKYDQKEYDKAIRFWELKVEEQEPQTEEEKDILKRDWYKKEYYAERYKNKETYAKCQSGFKTWAVITEDGKWYEKGSMGWWACSDETHDEAVDWELNFLDRFIKDLNPDTIISIYDCHI